MAFVTFQKRRDAESAVTSMRNFNLMGKQIKTGFANGELIEKANFSRMDGSGPVNSGKLKYLRIPSGKTLKDFITNSYEIVGGDTAAPLQHDKNPNYANYGYQAHARTNNYQNYTQKNANYEGYGQVAFEQSYQHNQKSFDPRQVEQHQQQDRYQQNFGGSFQKDRNSPVDIKGSPPSNQPKYNHMKLDMRMNDNRRGHNNELDQFLNDTRNAVSPSKSYNDTRRSNESKFSRSRDDNRRDDERDFKRYKTDQN